MRSLTLVLRAACSGGTRGTQRVEREYCSTVGRTPNVKHRCRGTQQQQVLRDTIQPLMVAMVAIDEGRLALAQQVIADAMLLVCGSIGALTEERRLAALEPLSLQLGDFGSGLIPVVGKELFHDDQLRTPAFRRRRRSRKASAATRARKYTTSRQRWVAETPSCTASVNNASVSLLRSNED